MNFPDAKSHRTAPVQRPTNLISNAMTMGVGAALMEALAVDTRYVAAAVANTIYSATGVRARNYPITLDEHLARLPRLI